MAEEITKGQALTPEKKSIIIQQILNEISAINRAIKDKSVDEEVLRRIKENRDRLQELLNKLLKKVGVITPSETDEILGKIEDSKKARLQKSYRKSLTTGTIVLVTFIALAGVLVYLSKRNKA